MMVSRRWEDAASLSKVTTKSEGSTDVRDSSSTKEFVLIIRFEREK